MEALDQLICKLLYLARRQPLLFRFTLGTRILLALGFIPTGFVKIMGLRFATNLDTSSGPGQFFELLYQSGHYWAFLGFVQLLAGVLILWKKTETLGAILFFAIILNIFFITISYEFSYTPVVSFSMLLASTWLIFWDWHKIRLLFTQTNDGFYEQINQIRLQLSGDFERAIYFIGFFAGLIFFAVMRGLIIPEFLIYIIFALCILSFFLAVILGFKNRKVVTE
jgi:uncharacterized membrane protein YphA (DoxX/SURF4 family)